MSPNLFITLQVSNQGSMTLLIEFHLTYILILLMIILSAHTDDSSVALLICSFCKRRLQSMNALRRHIASRHSEIQSKEYECFICMKNFKTKWSLSTHNSRFHRDSRMSKELTKFEFVDPQTKWELRGECVRRKWRWRESRLMTYEN